MFHWLAAFLAVLLSLPRKRRPKMASVEHKAKWFSESIFLTFVKLDGREEERRRKRRHVHRHIHYWMDAYHTPQNSPGVEDGKSTLAVRQRERDRINLPPRRCLLSFTRCFIIPGPRLGRLFLIFAIMHLHEVKTWLKESLLREYTRAICSLAYSSRPLLFSSHFCNSRLVM